MLFCKLKYYLEYYIIPNPKNIFYIQLAKLKTIISFHKLCRFCCDNFLESHNLNHLRCNWRNVDTWPNLFSLHKEEVHVFGFVSGGADKQHATVWIVQIILKLFDNSFI